MGMESFGKQSPKVEEKKPKYMTGTEDGYSSIDKLDFNEFKNPQWDDLDKNDPAIKSKLENLSELSEEISRLQNSEIYRTGSDSTVRRVGELQQIAHKKRRELEDMVEALKSQK